MYFANYLIILLSYYYHLTLFLILILLFLHDNIFYKILTLFSYEG